MVLITTSRQFGEVFFGHLKLVRVCGQIKVFLVTRTYIVAMDNKFELF